MLCARCTRFSEQIAGDPFIELIERGALQQVGIYEKEPFESYFSGNTIQICPVGALTRAAYRFRSRPFDLVSTPVDRRALRLRLRDPRRPPARQGDAPARRRRPRGQRGVDLRQGPLRVPLRPAGRPADPPAGPRRPSRRAAARVVARGLRGRGPRAGGGARRRRRADRRPAHRRGRLRLREVRPRRPRHQRHRLPGPPALRRGGRLPGRRGRRLAASASRTPTSRRARSVLLVGFEPEEEAPTSSCGCARPSAARGTPVCSIAPYTSRGLDKMAGTLVPTVARRRGRRARRRSAPATASVAPRQRTP